jgi:hypothetical protein
MANDAKLEQLKIVQERAFSQKQISYQKQQDSWKRLSDARDKMNRAFEAKQSNFEAQEREWQDCQSVSDRNGPRIERLNSDQEIAYQNMKNAFDKASTAHDSRDGASAKTYSNEGHSYKAEAQKCVEERRRLIEECKNARSRHAPYKKIFEEAKIAFGRAKDEHEQAKAAHERANDDFKRAKTEFSTAAKAFKARLDELKSQNTKRKMGKRAIAAKVGIPYQYRDDVHISEEDDGTTNIYFGGIGEPAGPGHGHYVLDSSGNITYKREPWDQHGPQNFTDHKDAEYFGYNRHMRSGKLPIMSGRGNGIIYLQGEEAGQSVHFTQIYDDGYHVSWDAMPDGTIGGVHWTNDKLSKYNRSRFIPPTDAKI